MAVSCMLGKRIHIQRGHIQVFPNLYVMLMGEPGTGKGVACDILQRILVDANYEYFAADRSSKEKFIQDLADGISFNNNDLDSLLASESNAGENLLSTEPRECFILAEEFSDFIGQNNSEFIAFLTKMWTFSGMPYRYRTKTGRSVAIQDPYINILGGSSSAAFALSFPPEIIAQGFLARIILVAGEDSGRRISFPKPPDAIFRSAIASHLAGIRSSINGEIILNEKVAADLDSLNQLFGGVDDPRFRDYNTRRFTQLLKLCIIHCAARGDVQLKVEDVERADSLLRETEHHMPKALGAFGKSKNADVSNKLLQALHSTHKPLKTMHLWRIVCDDLDKMQDLVDLLHKLKSADRIQQVNDGWLPKIAPMKELLNLPKKGE